MIGFPSTHGHGSAPKPRKTVIVIGLYDCSPYLSKGKASVALSHHTVSAGCSREGFPKNRDRDRAEQVYAKLLEANLSQDSEWMEA